MPTLWTNPTPGPGPAELQSKFQLNPGHPHYPQALPPNLAQQIGPILHDLAGAMEQRRNDSIKQKLLQDEATANGHQDLLDRYGAAGLTGQAAYNQYNDDTASENTPASQLHNRIPVNIGGVTANLTDDAFVRHMDQISARQAKQNAPQSDPILKRYGLDPSDVAGIDRNAINLTDATGKPLSDSYTDGSGKPLPTATKDQTTDANGNPLPTLTKGNDAYIDGSAGDKHFRIPRNQFQSIVNRYKLGAQQQDAPSALSTQQPNTLPTDSGPPQSTSPLIQQATPPPAAIQHLQANPQLAAQFDAKYGPGASAQYLSQ